MSINTFAELNKLKNIEISLTRAQTHFIDGCCKEDPTLIDFIQKINSESSTECKTKLQEVLDIHTKMQEIKAKISSEENPESLKTELIELKNAIENYKISSKHRLKELQIEEHHLAEDLQHYENLFETWSKPIEIIEEPTYIKRNTLAKIECLEVTEFDKFLHENLGHTHGWSVEDSAMFLKIKNKYKKCDKVAYNLHRVFPDKSLEEIQEYFQWHENYCALRNKKKEAIKQWRLNKLGTDSETTTSTNSAKSKKAPRVIRSFNIEETKQKILAWKEEKKQCEEQKKLIEQLNEQFNKQMSVMQNQKNLETKEAVARWRAIKLSEKRAIEAKRREEQLKTHAFKSMLANKFIKDFQAQDLRFIKRMQTSKLGKTNNQLIKPESKITAPRDPERLLKPTKTWVSKVTTEEKALRKIGFCNLNLNSIQKLKAPDWRK